MVDIQFIRENPELIKKKASEKGTTVDIDRLLKLDGQRRGILAEIESARAERNDLTEQLKASKPSDAQLTQGKLIKEKIQAKESDLEKIEPEFWELLRSVPNAHFDDVPLGGEHDFTEVKTYGGQPAGAKDHLDFATERGWLDFDRGAKVAGAKFYYIKGDLALLENAVFQHALNIVVSKGFTFMTVPHMVSSRVSSGTGFAPRSSEQNDEYFIEGEDLTLIATAEIPLTGYHADEIIEESALPLLYAGYSPCYRKEAGTYGKHTRGLFRVHQFNKLEMYAYTLADNSQETHERLLAIEEEIWQTLGIPYQVINIAAGDLGAPAAKKYDIQYWSPVDKVYRELTSCSNCTDFQTRNLNIRVRRKDGTVELLHSLNGTAVSLARTLVAILENFQTEDGKLKMPEVLKPYMNGREQL